MRYREGVKVKLRAGVSRNNILEGRENHKYAFIECSLGPGYPDGVKLDRDLNYCKYWNLADLEEVK